MCGKMEHGFHLHMEHQGLHGGEFNDGICVPIPNPPLSSTSRPNSMVVKKVCPREFIPPHIVAEAISTLRGLDLRWSGPITPDERRYVEQYVLAKYPQYSHGLIDDDASASASDNDVEQRRQRASPPAGSPPTSTSARGAASPAADGINGVAAVRLEPSRLLDMLARKASFPGSFVSIPEIQARNRVLRRCGLADDDYLVLFAPTPRDALVLVAESYPFFRGNYYMSILADGGDCVRAFAAYKDAKVIAAPESWLDLRIKGSQLSQYFRRKCKHAPKGLFAYPVVVSGGGGGAVDSPARYSLHWVSEAHRNGWHVLLDATGLAVGDRLPLSLHRPDFVTCALDDARAQPAPSRVTCLLVRRRSFDVTSKGDN
uniref:Aminotransferase class V domain-containing protein n=1 Tax=Oryza punctata TaxID=4537 RepID=A0A0E0MFI8_ORYPU